MICLSDLAINFDFICIANILFVNQFISWVLAYKPNSNAVIKCHVIDLSY